MLLQHTVVKNLKRIEKAWFPVSYFFAQLLSEASRACTMRVRRSSLRRLWNDLGSHACLHHRNRRPGTTTEERISGRREPHPEIGRASCRERIQNTVVGGRSKKKHNAN